MQAIRLTTEEAAVYDSGDDIAGRALARDLRARAHALLRGSATHVEIVHPAGFIAWVYDSDDLPDTCAEIYPQHRF
jgi:hypothetical protein